MKLKNPFSKIESVEKQEEIESNIKIEDEIVEEKIRKVDFKALKKSIENEIGEDYKFNNIDCWDALARLLIELENKITDYDTLLSDDASGHLVSLFLRRIINKKRKAIGKKSIQTNFIASGRHEKEEKFLAIKDFIHKRRSTIGKVLLITEHIATGRSISRLVEILDDLNVDFDVATISIETDPEEVSYRYNYDDKLIKRLKYGEVGSAGLKFYEVSDLSGVKKDESRSTNRPHPIRYKYAEQETINKVRKNLKILAEELEKVLD